MAKTKTEFLGEKDGVKVYFAQYSEPKTITAALKEIAQLHSRKQHWIVYQPSDHAELKKCFQKLVKALQPAHKAIITDVASFIERGELKPTGKELALATGSPKATYVGGELVNAANFVKRNVDAGSVVLIVGGTEAKVVSDGLLS